MNTYEVAVAAPVPKTLTYGHPQKRDPAEIIPVGMRVLVPLGRRKVTGYVVGFVSQESHQHEEFTLKLILDTLDPEPIFPESMISFYRWIAEYYHYPIGEVIRTALPGGLVSSSRRVIRLTPSGAKHLPSPDSSFNDQDRAWIATLIEKGGVSPARSADLLGKSSLKNMLREWLDNDWIRVEDELQQRQFQEKKEVFVSLAEEICEDDDPVGLQREKVFAQLDTRFPDLKKSERTTLEIFFEVRELLGKDCLARPDITRRYSSAGRALKSLAERQIITVEERRVYRDPFGQQTQFHERPAMLTRDQEQVLAAIGPYLITPGFKTFVLHGVTGCGKTEVYLRAAEEVLDKGNTVLVLVPEIALSSQLEAHFYSRFGEIVAVLHSGLSPAERHDQWQRILNGDARVVVGARSAVFAPLERLGLIIVDEEHEPAYKQDDGLRYNGRDLAILRGRYAGCPVILGSATPSVTTYYHAGQGKYELLQMPTRIAGQDLPRVEVVDLNTDKRSRPDLMFSDKLISALWKNMEQRRQSLLFVNRRGFASFVMCRDCGHIIECRHCQVSLTLHRGRQRLVCHYCGYSLPQNLVCPSCKSAKVEGMGLGSERIEEEVRQVIPHARVARLDSDTATSRTYHQKTLRAVHNQEVDILVGTQMIAKGLHFPNITLVGVVWADSGLGMPDFRASERTFQLLAQVTGRAGRGEHAGRVIIQTYQPNHYALQSACNHDYPSFYAQEVELRQDLQYPPFSRLVNIRFIAADEKKVRECADKTADFLQSAIRQKKFGGVEILGPAPAPLVRIKDKVRWQILLKGPAPSLLHKLCYFLQDKQVNLCSGKVRLSIDVDPESMM